jgi:hypothetical protein
MRKERHRLMVTYRRLAVVVVVALVVIAALPNPTGLRVAAVGAVALLAAGYAMWLANRGEWTRHERPAAAPDARVAEIISARVGEPTHAAAPFMLRTQHTPHERWHGEEPLWMAISDTWLWLLHRTLDGGVGGVKSRFSRGGLHARWDDHRLQSHHVGEVSWPADLWFIAGELHGTRPQRLRLIGLLAGDELGMRHLVTRSQPPSR